MTAASLFLALLFLLISGYGALGYDSNRVKCTVAVETWAEQAGRELSELSHDHHTGLKELLYFLHVPRTGGRTYHQCLLRNLYPREQHCDRSYDKLRFNSSNHCRLLVTHDDYSILTKLPAASTSVVTNIRHPIDRIFSAYEFSVEVAARFLARNLRKKPNITKAAKSNGSSTLNIWPWSLLVPWMRDDLFNRERIRLSGEAEPLALGFSNYDASSFVMPLHEFIRQPMAVDILHNGATYQVAGLTNNSFIKEAGKIRRCVIDYPDLGLQVLNVAKRRIDKMIFVGLTDKHGDSAKFFAHIVGGQIFPLGQPINSINGNDVPSTTNAALSDAGTSDSNLPTSQVPSSASLPPPLDENLTVYRLIERYQKCAGRLRSAQIQRRIASLRHSLPVNFSSEARQEVPEETLDEIRKMNALDLDLYAYAQQHFKSQVLTHESLHKRGSKQSASEHFKIWDTDASVGGGLQGAVYSRSRIFLSVICMAGGIVAMAASLTIFVHGSRVLRSRRGQSRVVLHEKW